jgi:uncharacterized protein (TIGR02145 family)
MKKIGFILIIVLSYLFCTSCKKDQSNPTNPYNGKTTAVFNPSVTYGSMTDQDGNTYKTVVIGTQTWMAENLRTTKYQNGDQIPQFTDSLSWSKLSSGAYCDFNNIKNADFIATYGRLYNWLAATDSRKIAPTGWHLPTDAEWNLLITFLGGDTLAGDKLKEAGSTHWSNPNIGANNETGFTALPSGWRFNDGGFAILGVFGDWWSSTPSTVYANQGWDWAIYYNDIFVINESSENQYGFSVRCVKD